MHDTTDESRAGADVSHDEEESAPPSDVSLGFHGSAVRERKRGEGLPAWLKARIWVAVVAVSCVAAFLAGFERYGLPRLALYVADHLPASLEARVGSEALEQLDDGEFEPSGVEPAEQLRLRSRFAELVRSLPGRDRMRLEFRTADFGPNAFALPGGLLVVTDDLVHACQTDEVIAVLAHEVGHHQRHHFLRQLLLDSGTLAAASALFGDVTSLTAGTAALSALLAERKFSRELESEADAYALDLLAKRGLDPQRFASALRCIARELPDSMAEGSFLSTHPALGERAAQAEAQASARRPTQSWEPSRSSAR